jgi:tetratricopeptide (TPR) repeat protein
MRRTLAIGIALLSATATVPESSAEDLSSREVALCLDFEAPPETRISGCTWAIQNAGLSVENLGIAYNNRGVARGQIYDYSNALADLNEAIRLYPRAKSYMARADVYCSMSWDADDRGDDETADAAYVKGEADMKQAMALDPSIGSLEDYCF